MKATDIIVYDLEEYASSRNKVVADALDDLLSIIPLSQREVFDKAGESKFYQAWWAYQLLNNTHKALHTSSELGEFIYDTRMFKIFELEDGPNYIRRLLYNDSCGLQLVIPDGLTSMRYTFCNCNLNAAFALGNQVCTSMITDMTCAFKDATFAYGFNFGYNFDVSHVKSMYGMFEGAKFRRCFKLPKQFDNLQGVNIKNMFKGATLEDKPLDNKDPVAVLKSLTS